MTASLLSLMWACAPASKRDAPATCAGPDAVTSAAGSRSVPMPSVHVSETTYWPGLSPLIVQLATSLLMVPNR